MAQFIHLEETDSTNRYLHSLVITQEAEHGTTVMADFQTDGHGQMNNHWESMRGMNILISTLLEPDTVKVEEQFIISEIVTLAICKILNSELGGGVEIKWPNDIYVGDKKICGILIENSIMGNRIDNSIIGIGINVNQTLFESDAPNPTSMKLVTGKEFNCKTVAQNIVLEILRLYHERQFHKLHTQYMSHLYRREGYHEYEDLNGKRFQAVINDIDPQGGLTLTLPNNSIRKFYFKEVKFVL